MADGFGVDTAAARSVASDLTTIRTALNGFGATVADGSTGSPKVEGALQRFFKDSSDNRKLLDKLLERGIGLMNGLAEGAESLDQGLAGALTTSGDGAAPGGGAPTRGPR
ncbi:hypothetical protein [Kineosporia sp. R_H_3]|uniref:hypothetical protein n=1 Tax=Kineosporia sp. R_H_3 TaxID=1961848 RepID=UPI000B4A5B69|nr:hypothetical protein [Kineosporia sp. R_H_3]